MTAPLVSVIMPMYNAERFVAQALNSIFAQDHAALDVIVIDDGSTDRSREIVDWYRDRIRVIEQPNSGPAAARNAGLAQMRGEFVAFLDADDLWHPAKLSAQLNEFALDPDLEVSICKIRNFWDGDPAQAESELRRREYVPVMVGIVVQALLVRRSVFDELDGFDTSFRFGEDTDFYVRMSQRGTEGRLIDKELGYRRVHENNLTVDFPRQKEDTMWQVVQAALARSRAKDRRAPDPE